MLKTQRGQAVFPFLAALIEKQRQPPHSKLVKAVR